jgi:hypothetical protein
VSTPDRWYIRSKRASNADGFTVAMPGRVMARRLLNPAASRATVLEPLVHRPARRVLG